MKVIKISGNRYMIEGSQRIYSEDEIKRMKAEIDIKTDDCVKSLYVEEVKDEPRDEVVVVEFENIEKTADNIRPYSKPRRK